MLPPGPPTCTLKAKSPMFSSLTLLGTIKADNFESANASLPMLSVFNSVFDGKVIDLRL